jgi:multiple sugar transport system substrate-binding protein
MKALHFAGLLSAVTCLSIGLAQTTKVVFWEFSTRDADISAWESAISEFEQQNPDIDVEMEIVPWAEQQQRLVSALATGGLPDVSFLGNNVVAQFQAIGALAPLDEFFAKHSQDYGYDVTEDAWPGDQGYYQLAGHWWAAPLAVETRSLYYRTDLFEEAGLDPEAPPQTWDELVAAADQLKSVMPAGAYPIALPMSIEYLTIQNFMSWYLSHGASLLNSEGRCGLDTPEFKTALEKYTGVFKAGLTHPDAATKPGNEFRRGFLDGNYAMIVDQPGIWADLQREQPDFVDSVQIALVPQGPEGRRGFLGGYPLVLWNASQVKDAAAKWIMFATRPEGALKDLAVTSGAIPGSRSLAQGSPWNKYPFTVFVEQLQDAVPYQFPAEAIPQMGQLEVDAFQSAIQSVALDQANVDQATQSLCQRINDVLSR